METLRVRRRRWGRNEEQRIGFLRKPLRAPRAKLVLEHLGKHGHRFAIVPAGVRVSDEEAATLIRRRLVRVCDAGLFSDAPQSWTSN
jgi:hypothetical protein